MPSAAASQTLSEAARNMRYNLRNRFRKFQHSDPRIDTRFHSSDRLYLCLYEFTPEADQPGCSYFIAMLGDQGLEPLLHIPFSPSRQKSGPDIWQEVLDTCEAEGLRLEDWSHADLPPNTKAVKINSPVKSWMPVVY